MTKRQLIDDIRRFNLTAQIEFLEQFDEPALTQYLEHLQEAVNKRMRYAGITPKNSGTFKMVS
jgi:hypothetical protein